jgi:hypothetical protein
MSPGFNRGSLPYLPFRLATRTVWVTVVRGERLAVEVVTNRPVMALRGTRRVRPVATSFTSP